MKESNVRVVITAKVPTAKGARRITLRPDVHFGADFGPSTFSDADPVDVDRKNISNLGGMRPQIDVDVQNVLSKKESDKLNVQVTFDGPTDDWPRQVVEHTPVLKELVDISEELRELKRQLKSKKGRDLRETLADLFSRSPSNLEGLLDEFSKGDSN